MTPLDPLNDGVLRRIDLLARGMRPKQITRAVRAGSLIRLRRDRYAEASQPDVDRAVRLGGRLSCVSLLALLGVFVLDASLLHVQVDHSMSRLRSPDDRSRPFGRHERATVVLHWWHRRGEAAGLGLVGVADALAHAVRCQDARAAVATVDSILHAGLMTPAEVREVFAGLPARYQIVLRLADGRAESGPETYMRLILRQLGLRFEAQVEIDGVGRVDFLVEGWLIIECDSKAHHEGWDKQRVDRRRDLAAAALGYVSLRPLAQDLLYDRSVVVSAVRGITARRARPARR